MRMFVATATLKNEVTATAYFYDHDDAVLWVKAKNSDGLLDTYVIDNREIKINEFL